MHGLALGVGVSTLRRNGYRWWSAPGRTLDGQLPSILIDVPRGGFRTASGPAALSDWIAVSSVSKKVVGPNGTLDTIAANQPALDWSSGRRRLLIETGAATKYGPFSEAVGANWNLAGLTAGGTVLGADGTAGLSTLVEDTSTGLHRVYASSSYYPTAAGAGEFVAVQIDAKLGVGSRNLCLALSGTGISPTKTVFVNLTTGAVVSKSPEIARVSVTPRAGGIWHIEATCPTTGAGPTTLVTYLSPSGAVLSYEGDGVSSVHLGYANLEKVSAATSPPTSYVGVPSSAAVTRIGDVVGLTSAALGVFQSAAVTMALRGTMITPVNGTARVVFEAQNAGGTERIRLQKATSSQAIAPSLTAGGVAQSVPTLSGADADFGLAVGFASGLFRAALDGGAAVDTAIAAPDRTAMTQAILGNAVYPCRFWIDEIAIWPFLGSAAGLAGQAHLWR